jgi:hypothetical protein
MYRHLAIFLTFFSNSGYWKSRKTLDFSIFNLKYNFLATYIQKKKGRFSRELRGNPALPGVPLTYLLRWPDFKPGNRFLQAGKGAENTKEKSKQCFTRTLKALPCFEVTPQACGSWRTGTKTWKSQYCCHYPVQWISKKIPSSEQIFTHFFLSSSMNKSDHQPSL